jgi:uncharacterized membrane protein YfcA
MPLELLVVTAGGLLASFINAAFATGGIYIVLASSSLIFPLAIAIPLQSAFAFASLAARIVYFRPYIYWPVVRLFVIGSVIGVAIGSTVFVALPEATIALLLGFFLLLLIWAPSFTFFKRVKNNGDKAAPGINHDATNDTNSSNAGIVDTKKETRTAAPAYTPIFFPVGVAHSFLGTVFGVGTLLQPTILRTSLTKLQITGTLAACLLIMDVFKLTGYVAHGFDYTEYWPHILCATVAGFVGTVLGKRVTHRVSEQTFRQVFKCVITLVALRLIYRGFTLW